ncbi:MAG: DEAD/DEAH box helicase, partial [Deltaproteobacteria bacterium]
MLSHFSPATRQWFGATFDQPTRIQTRGWATIAERQHALLLAPTGSGKTLAAFLWSIDRLLRLPVEAPAAVRVLYISPLKALVYDIERNLRAPLIGTLRAAQTLGQTTRQVRVDIRTGDTPQALRRQQARNPADILVTTPESLFLLLTSKAAATLTQLETIIVDEIHALAPTKRGAHLALSLERLTAMQQAAEPQRLGLSATVRPHDEAARFLGGQRPVCVVDESARANIDLRIVVPVPDMDKQPPTPPAEEQGGAILGKLMRTDDPVPKRGNPAQSG